MSSWGRTARAERGRGGGAVPNASTPTGPGGGPLERSEGEEGERCTPLFLALRASAHRSVDGTPFSTTAHSWSLRSKLLSNARGRCPSQ